MLFPHIWCVYLCVLCINFLSCCNLTSCLKWKEFSGKNTDLGIWRFLLKILLLLLTIHVICTKQPLRFSISSMVKWGNRTSLNLCCNSGFSHFINTESKHAWLETSLDNQRSRNWWVSKLIGLALYFFTERMLLWDLSWKQRIE